MEPTTPATEEKQTTSDDEKKLEDDAAVKRAIRRASISTVRAGIAKRERAMSGQQGKEGGVVVEGSEDAKAETTGDSKHDENAEVEGKKEAAKLA